MDKKLIIFDVDGTLVRTKSGETFRKSADDWQWLPGRLEKLEELNSQGIKTAVATNQGGVAFGYMQRADIYREIVRMAAEADILGVEICYAHPKGTVEEFRAESPNRKPGPGMLLTLMDAYQEQKADTLMVGDREEDKLAAEAAGVDFAWAHIFFGK